MKIDLNAVYEQEKKRLQIFKDKERELDRKMDGHHEAINKLLRDDELSSQEKRALAKEHSEELRNLRKEESMLKGWINNALVRTRFAEELVQLEKEKD